ncbi:hypothetical protein GCM10027456_81770 [Kineosporia babensis]
MTSERANRLREDVEARLRAADVRPLLVAHSLFDSTRLNVILEAALGRQDVALAVAAEIDGVKAVRFLPGGTGRSIMRLELRP